MFPSMTVPYPNLENAPQQISNALLIQYLPNGTPVKHSTTHGTSMLFLAPLTSIYPSQFFNVAAELI